MSHWPSTNVRVSRKAEARLASGHPWIFSSDVVDRGDASAGESVAVVNADGRPLGTAHFSTTSQITLRMLSDRVEATGRSFLKRRLEAAAEFRGRVVRDSDAYRLVHGEADGLPGLVVDRYGDYLVLQALTQGMDRATPELVSCLRELLAPAAIVARNDAAVRIKEGLKLEVKLLSGQVPERAEVRIHGLRFFADLLHGQKTGMFLDQRENYAAAARHAHGRALDCFTSGGGFAVHMAARCESVETADSSGAALRLARANRDANGITNIQLHEADVFELLAGYVSSGRTFATVVLDPPAFAKSRSGVEGAIRGYKEINLRALRLLGPGGVLVTCSCSHHVSEAEFLETVAAAALDAGRRLRVLERRTQAADHPILLTVPETHYLKCVILGVI
ncbi:MAG: class I SAM-dependent rRNA methyltransferase [Bryobacterales bacterium]|nr:class I SAM-dependent rRNA methyltransferase [Bryobacterales bacterium]